VPLRYRAWIKVGHFRLMWPLFLPRLQVKEFLWESMLLPLICKLN